MDYKKPILLKYRIKPRIKLELSESSLFNMPLYPDEYDKYIQKMKAEKIAEQNRQNKKLLNTFGIRPSKSRNLIERYKNQM